MRRSAEALVNAELLRWGRDTAGFSVDQAAKRVGVTPTRLEGWESGQHRPTVAQARKLADLYKRPLAAFYLREPPPPLQPLRDFRRSAAVPPEPPSPELRLAHRQALYRREVALELCQELGSPPVPWQARATVSDSLQEAEQTGLALRELLGITLEEQTSWGDRYEALRAWRAACEARGVLVCQASGVEPGEMSGFSVAQQPLPVIVLNIRDAPERRIFTMVHEFTHLAIEEGGLCRVPEEPRGNTGERRIEVFCNRAAAAALVPRDHLLKQDIVRRPRRPTDWSDEDIRALADLYRVSREVTVLRLLAAGLATRGFYLEKRDQFRREPVEAPGWGPPWHQVAVARTGPLFARLVLEAYGRSRITASDALDYLGVRLKHLPRIGEYLAGQP